MTLVKSPKAMSFFFVFMSKGGAASYIFLANIHEKLSTESAFSAWDEGRQKGVDLSTSSNFLYVGVVEQVYLRENLPKIVEKGAWTA